MPIFILLSFSLVIVQDIKSFGQIRAKIPSYPKAVFLSPTPPPLPLPTLTPTPTLNPTPIPVEKEQTQTQIQTISIKEFLLGEVNKYRQSLGLYAVSSDSYTCDFAKKRAEELSKNFNHDGFKNPPYPSYARVTENIAMNRNYKQVVNNWINSQRHAENMRADTPFVCIEKFEDYYAYEGWKPQ